MFGVFSLVLQSNRDTRGGERPKKSPPALNPGQMQVQGPDVTSCFKRKWLIDILLRSILIPQEMTSEVHRTPRTWGELRFLNSLVSEAVEERELCSQESAFSCPVQLSFFLCFLPTDSTTCSSAKSKVSARAVLKVISLYKPAHLLFGHNSWESCD